MASRRSMYPGALTTTSTVPYPASAWNVKLTLWPLPAMLAAGPPAVFASALTSSRAGSLEVAVTVPLAANPEQVYWVFIPSTISVAQPAVNGGCVTVTITASEASGDGPKTAGGVSLKIPVPGAMPRSVIGVPPAPRVADAGVTVKMSGALLLRFRIRSVTPALGPTSCNKADGSKLETMEQDSVLVVPALRETGCGPQLTHELVIATVATPCADPFTVA